MPKDQLSPEDRALHDAFFEAYRVKFNELNAGASEGAEVSLDACTVHAIKVMNAKEIDRRLARVSPAVMRAAVVELVRQNNRELIAIGAEPEHIEFLGKFAADVAEQTTRLLLAELAKEPPDQRIVEAVGRGVRVRHGEEGGA